MRESDFSGSTFNGAYLEKAVAYKANFSGIGLSQYKFFTECFECNSKLSLLREIKSQILSTNRLCQTHCLLKLSDSFT